MIRFSSSTFCDDIRNEVNGKISLMGVVGGNLYVQEFPFVVPRLCALISVFTPMDQPFKHLNIKGDYEGVSLFDIEMSDADLEQLTNEMPDNPFQTVTAAQAMFVVSPLALDGPGRLKISITADGEDVYCPGLTVQKAPDGMNLS